MSDQLEDLAKNLDDKIARMKGAISRKDTMLRQGILMRYTEVRGEIATLIHREREGKKKMKWTRRVRETGLVEWICEHGIGHPDMNSVKKMGGDSWGIHGCDGCCSREDFPGKLKGTPK